MQGTWKSSLHPHDRKNAEQNLKLATLVRSIRKLRSQGKPLPLKLGRRTESLRSGVEISLGTSLGQENLNKLGSGRRLSGDTFENQKLLWGGPVLGGPHAFVAGALPGFHSKDERRIPLSFFWQIEGERHFEISPEHSVLLKRPA